jgi:hypothetical protein
VGQRLGAAVAASRIGRAGKRIENTLSWWVSGSRIVKWFLAEPDLDVIVIDLRETYTVGPVLRAIEWAVGHGRRLADRIGLTAAAESTAAWVRSQPLRVAGIGLLGVAIGGTVSAALSSGSLGGWLVLSGIALLALRERRSWDQLRTTRVGRALAAAFEPPEPPENERQSPDSDSGDD